MAKSVTDDVKLYYLGGIAAEENPQDREAVLKTRIVPPKIRSFGKVFNLPPIGGYITLKRFMAKDLMGRHPRVVWIADEEGEWDMLSYSAFTLNPEEARSAKEGRTYITETGRMVEKPDKESLLAMLAEIEKEEKAQTMSTDSSPGDTTANKKSAKTSSKVSPMEMENNNG